MTPPGRILVLGATGHFGSRISRRLARQPEIDLVLSSRTRAKAEALALALRQDGAAASLRGTAIDQDSEGLPEVIHELAPFIVVHTAGPYQGKNYRVAEACIAAGSHYIDLADAREFVCNISRLDAEARRSGVLVVSGASTLPGLSSAVVDRLRPQFASIDRIEIAIAPAHQMPRGHGTVAAVLSYCGKPFRMLVDGRWTTAHGWQNLQIHRYPSLGLRFAGACDVPDLSLLPENVPGVDTVSFHAALESRLEQLSLWLMAWLSRIGFVRDWSASAGWLGGISKRFSSFGSDRGGMRVRMSGRNDEGKQIVANWHLVAEQNHGPEIPCAPSLVLVRKLLDGSLTDVGARPCLGLFDLDDFLDEMSGFSISTEVVMEARS